MLAHACGNAAEAESFVSIGDRATGPVAGAETLIVGAGTVGVGAAKNASNSFVHAWQRASTQKPTGQRGSLLIPEVQT